MTSLPGAVRGVPLFMVLAACSVLAPSGAEASMAACTTVTFLSPPSTFPARITKPGCYALKGNGWNVPDANTTGIKIIAANVILNLNNRELKGPVTCPIGPTGAVCSLTGTGVGVDAGTVKNVAIFNGHVRGFGAHGVRTGKGARLQDLETAENGLAGIATNDLTELLHIISEQNGGNGLSGGDGVNVSESRFNDNAKKGLHLQSDAILRRINALRNLEEGIRASDNFSMTDGHVSGNKLRGLLLALGAQIFRVSARDNTLDGFKVGDDSLLDGVTAGGNGKDGINAGKKSKIRNALATDNEGDGVSVDDASSVEDCVSSGNKKGVVILGIGGRVSGNTVKDNTDKGLELGLSTLFQSNALAGNLQHFTGGVNAGSNVCDTALCP